MSRAPNRSMNSNQNYYTEEGRTQKRVLQEPGGRSSIQLGWSTAPTVVQENDKSLEETQEPKRCSSQEPTGNKNLCEKRNEPNIEINCPSNTSGRALGLPVSGNKFANGSNMNCGNVITDRPSSRVSQPPGGKSSIHFG